MEMARQEETSEERLPVRENVLRKLGIIELEL
jgi:hypothetical protein